MPLQYVDAVEACYCGRVATQGNSLPDTRPIALPATICNPFDCGAGEPLW